MVTCLCGPAIKYFTPHTNVVLSRYVQGTNSNDDEEEDDDDDYYYYYVIATINTAASALTN